MMFFAVCARVRRAQRDARHRRGCRRARTVTTTRRGALGATGEGALVGQCVERGVQRLGADVVREGLVGDRGRGDRVVLVVQVLVGLGPVGGAVLALQVGQQVGVVDLGAAALAEDAADQAGDRDDVGVGPLLRHRRVGCSRDVVGRQLARVGGDRVDVGVDALDVGVDQRLGLRTLRAVPLRQGVDLGLRLGGGVRREQQLVVVHLLEVAAGAEERGERARAVVAQDVHQEEPVLGLRVAGPEPGRRVGVTVDVGHVVLVAVDRDARSRGLGAGDVGRLDAERLVVEVVGELGVGQARGAVEQVGVLRQLVGTRRGPGAVRLELERVGGVDQTVLPRWEHVHRLAVGVVALAVVAPGASSPRGAGRTGRDRCHRHRRQDRQTSSSTHAHAHFRIERVLFVDNGNQRGRVTRE